MRSLTTFLFITLSAFTCVKTDSPPPTAEPEAWILTNRTRTQVEGAPYGAPINGQYITRTVDSVIYDDQYNPIGVHTASYSSTALLQSMEQVSVIEGDRLFFLNNGARVPVGVVNPQTKTLLYQPWIVNTALQSHGLVDTVVATEQINEYDAGNYRTKDSLHTLRAKHYAAAGRWVRHRQDDYRVLNFRYASGNLVEDIEFNTRTDSFYSRLDSTQAYRLDSVRYSRIQSGLRVFEYGTLKGLSEIVLPYNKGRNSENLPTKQTLYRNRSQVPGSWDPLLIGTTEYSYVFSEGLLTEQTQRNTEGSGAVRVWQGKYNYRKKP